MILDASCKLFAAFKAVSSSTRYALIESIVFCLFKIIVALFVGAVSCFCQLSLCPLLVKQVEPCIFILGSQLFDIRVTHYSFATRVQAYDWKFVSIDSSQDEVTDARLMVISFTASISELLLSLSVKAIIADVT